MEDLLRDLQKRIAGEVRFDPFSRMLYSTDASIYQIEPIGAAHFPDHHADGAAAQRLLHRPQHVASARRRDREQPFRRDADLGTGDTYLVAATDSGHNITCTVAAINALGKTTAPPSNAIAIA